MTGIGVEPTVELVAAVWEQVLRRPVSPHQNFFEIGGDSLLLLQVHGELEGRLGRDVELIDLLRHPTVASLAAALAGSAAPSAVPSAGSSGSSASAGAAARPATEASPGPAAEEPR